MTAQLWNSPLVYVLALGVVTALIRVGMWVGSVNEYKRVVTGFMAQIREDIKEIREDIKKMLRRSGSAAVTSDSPLRLTELGNAIAAELDATSWAQQTAACVRDQVEGKRPYEIQEFCLGYLDSEEFRPSDEFTIAIRTCAYDHGLDEDQVRFVLAIVLRDDLLATATVHS